MITLPNFNQWGQPWSSIVIGKDANGNSRTVGQVGCLGTAITTALHNYAIHDDPGQFFPKIKTLSGFQSSGDLLLSTVEDAYHNVFFWDSVDTTNSPAKNTAGRVEPSEAIRRINRLIRLGQPVMLNVDNVGHDGNPDHFICAYDVLPGDYRIKNPDGGLDQLFSQRYGDPLKGIYGYRAFLGEPIAFPDDGLPEEGGSLSQMVESLRMIESVHTDPKDPASADKLKNARLTLKNAINLLIG